MVYVDGLESPYHTTFKNRDTNFSNLLVVCEKITGLEKNLSLLKGRP